MGANTKIFVFKAKELIYTGIFIVLGILFILLLIFMFLPKGSGTKEDSTAPAMQYLAGVYSSTIHLNGSTVDVKVAVTDEKITSISLSNLSKETASMYPLLEPAVEEINNQLKTADSLDDITFDSDSQYTNTILKQAMQNALQKAVPAK